MRARLGLLAFLLLLPAGSGAEERARPAAWQPPEAAPSPLEGEGATPPSAAPAEGAGDRSAIEEARRSAEASEPYASHRAYAHYLEARREEARGNLAGALVHLRQARLYDEGDAQIRFHLARLRLKTGDREKARAGLERLVEEAPGHAPAWMLLGFARRVEGRLAAAVEAFERAIAADPGLEDAYLALLALRIDRGQFAEAEALAARLAERRPGEGKGYRVLSVLAKEQGEAGLALRSLRRAVAIEPENLPAALELAALEEQAGRHEEAAALYGQVLRRDPSDAVALLGSARTALRMGDEGAARAFIRQLFGTHPDPVGVRLQTAMDLGLARRPDRALEVLEEAKGISPSDPRITYYEGLVLEGKGELRRAAEAYRQVPANAGALYPLSRARRADVLSRLGAWKEALRSLELASTIAERLLDEAIHAEVLRFFPDVYRRAQRSHEAVAALQAAARRLPENRTVALSLARALLDTGQSGEAIRLLEARAAGQADEGILYALAIAKERAGDPEGAVEVASRILDENPEDPAALNFKGYLLADHGLRLGEARRLLLRAVELRPDEPAFLDSLGWCELQRGELGAAEPYLLRAAELRPKDPEILHHLAELHFRAGRIERAVATWQRALRALERDPDQRLFGIIERRLSQAKTRLR